MPRDSGSSTLTYSATGLPAGLSINSSSGLISGTPTTAGTSSVTVKATDTTGAAGSASFTWTVNAERRVHGQAAARQPGLRDRDGRAMDGDGRRRSSPPARARPPHSGSYAAWLDGYGTTHADILARR